MSVIAILQARMSSSRLPQKVLHPIVGKPMLALQCERVLRSKLIDSLIIATSNDESDQPIEALGNALGLPVYRGSLENVLERYYRAAQTTSAKHIVRITGDCPLAAPEIIDAVIAHHLAEQADYTSNCHPPTLPDGLDVEVMTIAALNQAYSKATKPSEKEHVTPYIVNHPEQFHLANYLHPQDLSQFRWTVDQREDFELVERIYQQLYPKNRAFTTEDILALMQAHPELQAINANINRNEGMEKSFKQDKEEGYE